MHAPPQGVSSRYAMGWFATQLEEQPILEHNGILSVYYADAVVLPKAHIGIALLYNIDAMPAALWVFPRIKKGIIAILTHRPAPFQPVITIRLWNGLFSALILLTVGLGCRSLLHRHQWMARAACVPLWQLLPHFLWWLLPTLLLAFYPALILWASGRSFGYQELIRSMPDISLWLGMCALIGALNASLRMRSFRRSGGTAGSCQGL